MTLTGPQLLEATLVLLLMSKLSGTADWAKRPQQRRAVVRPARVPRPRPQRLTIRPR
jgi:uncharacterized iron-regulated membrane protein